MFSLPGSPSALVAPDVERGSSQAAAPSGESFAREVLR
jgi:hypothetical protein